MLIVLRAAQSRTNRVLSGLGIVLDGDEASFLVRNVRLTLGSLTMKKKGREDQPTERARRSTLSQ
jgi:hypothetical protein